MTVKRASLLEFLLVVACVSAPAVVHAQSAQIEERIAASFVLALGRTPTTADVEQWAKDGPRTVADLFSRHREALRHDAAAGREVAAKAAQDAFGRAPSEDELRVFPTARSTRRSCSATSSGSAGTRWSTSRSCTAPIGSTSSATRTRSNSTTGEARPALSFVLLAACVENWARRNQPGLMATAGVPSVSVNSPYLAAVRLSPAVAAEARAAAGLPPPGDAALAAALGRHVVAPGAGTLASVGGIHFAAAGETLYGRTPGGEAMMMGLESR